MYSELEEVFKAVCEREAIAKVALGAVSRIVGQMAGSKRRGEACWMR